MITFRFVGLRQLFHHIISSFGKIRPLHQHWWYSAWELSYHLLNLVQLVARQPRKSRTRIMFDPTFINRETNPQRPRDILHIYILEAFKRDHRLYHLNLNVPIPKWYHLWPQTGRSQRFLVILQFALAKYPPSLGLRSPIISSPLGSARLVLCARGRRRWLRMLV
jgi:hypothetical protein